MTAQDARELDGLLPEGPSAILRGTARGLEMVIDARAQTDAIIAALEIRLGEAPAFFRNSNVRITVEHGPLPTGALSRLDELAQRFELRIVEVAARSRAFPEALPEAPALGSAPNALEGHSVAEARASAEIAKGHSASDEGMRRWADPSAPSIPGPGNPVSVAEAPPAPSAVPVAAAQPQTRIVEGPIRSGVILEHVGHLIVFGDVNPGAEVRATGNIVVLGCLRGTAHAGIGRDVGFILALQLEPRQLRIGRKVARADANAAASGAEIAYATNESIVVERYSGRLPRNLSASM